MVQQQGTRIRQCLEEWSNDVALLGQNNLLNESAFIKFTNDRGLPVCGAVTGDPGNFYRRGWLTADGVDSKDSPLFHPFRMYPVHKIFKACDLNILPSATLNRENITELTQHAVESLRPIDAIGNAAITATEISDLAILLEPVYWRRVTNRESRRMIVDGHYVDEAEYDRRLQAYRLLVRDLVGSLDDTLWEKKHEQIRKDAALLDENNTLYVLLRLAKWSEREKLTGPISGALWLRHMAEVIRRAFEESHQKIWLEEDRAFETWFADGRKIIFGFDRPLDREIEAKPYLAGYYGLYTGSAVRWYVEGLTEYYAIIEILPNPAILGIEIVNLKGNLASERDTATLKLGEWLLEDKAQKRFSIISFDTDVPANVKAIQRQISKGSVVGFIAAHTPDFEFANFTLSELVDIAAGIDEQHGVSGDAVRNADWNGVINARQFESRYKSKSARVPPSLKGAEWGKALARYATKHPVRADDGTERVFWQEVDKALRSRFASYDLENENWQHDPVTFKPIARNRAD